MYVEDVHKRYRIRFKAHITALEGFNKKKLKKSGPHKN